jgi:hypothetical protein
MVFLFACGALHSVDCISPQWPTSVRNFNMIKRKGKCKVFNKIIYLILLRKLTVEQALQGVPKGYWIQIGRLCTGWTSVAAPTWWHGHVFIREVSVAYVWVSWTCFHPGSICRICLGLWSAGHCLEWIHVFLLNLFSDQWTFSSFDAIHSVI